MSLLVKQTQQSKSLCNLVEMSEALIEGMNLILHQLDTINSCLPPPQYDSAQPHHPTSTEGQSGKSTITQSVAPVRTPTPQMKAVSNLVNLLPQTEAPPWPPPRPVRPPKPSQSKPKSCPHKKTVQTKFPVTGRHSAPSQTKDCLCLP